MWESFCGMEGMDQRQKGGQEGGRSLEQPKAGARSCFAPVCFGQRGNGADGLVGDKIHLTWPGWLSARSHPRAKAQQSLLGWHCLAEWRVPPPIPPASLGSAETTTGDVLVPC